MSGPAIAFLGCLAINYFDDFVCREEYWHTTNIIGAIMAAFICVAIERAIQ